MSTRPNLEQDLARLIADLAGMSQPSYRDDIVLRTARTRQRPAWTFPERWLLVDISTQRVWVAPVRWRPIALLLLVALLATALLAVAVGSQRHLPAPYGPAGNGLIAYTTKGDIYLGDPATGTSRAIVSGPDLDLVPKFSRDGTHLFFLRLMRSSGYQLMVANADGSGVRQVSSQMFTNVTGGEWSGDGRFLLFASWIDNASRISIVDVEGGGVRTIDVGMSALYPTFRPPDGRQIAFTVGEASGAAVYVVDRDGGHPQQLASGGGPVYSPDGSQIAYGRSYQPALEMNETRVMSADGSNDRVVGDRPDIQYQGTAAWSPDGTKLLLFRVTRRNQTLAMVPADGSGPGQEFSLGFRGFGSLGWSPDGSQIVSTPNDEDVEASLVRLDDGTIRRVPRWYVGDWQRVAP
jgi:Tol biopolymer transport system component